MRITVIITVMLLLGMSANAATVGLVVDGEGHPLKGVSIVTDIGGIGDVSDENGSFELPSDRGISRVTFSSVGYRARQFTWSNLPFEVVLERTYIRGDDIIVRADRARSGETPVAFDNISPQEIERDYTVGEFPLLLESTPNVVTFSDGGTPLGYSYVKIRGFDDKRIATYINGVPLNDPEDQATYFVDLPDFAANITDIQVQRGVGNSLYGDASFGGSINVVTSGFSRERRTAVSFGYGEYTSDGESVSDIYKQSVEYSTGLLDGRWAFSGRFSKQKTGGYRYGSWYHGWSYYFSIARLDPNMWTELYVYGGPIRMHLSYYGASRDDIDNDRRANPYLTYSNETDNFNQPHYHLHNIYRISENVTLANTLYYIRGKGYYEQFKDDRLFEEYNLEASQTGGIASGDLVRQQWVEKSQYGWNPRLDVNHERGRHSLGGSFYYFESDHWGQLVWAQHLTGTFDPQHKYYRYYGTKYVGSLWGQEDYRITERLSVLATVQLRYLRYEFDQVRMGAFNGYDYTLDWVFASPRIGFTYRVDSSLSLFTSFSMSSRTPTDAAIYDANDPNILPSLEIESVTETNSGDSLFQFGDPTANDEHVLNFELGGLYRRENFNFGVNFFWMDFRDEIIPYGGVNENTGLAITVNADRSVHAGVELSGAVLPAAGLKLEGNLAWNYSRVKEFESDIDGKMIDFADKTIVGFPDVIANVLIDYNPDPYRVTFKTRFVGRQYMELYNIDEVSIEPYSVSSLALAYTFEKLLASGRVTLQARIDNVFDEKYEAAGYGGNYLGDTGAVAGWAEYFVGTERSFYGQIKMELF